MANSTRTFPLTEKLMRSFTATAMVSLAVIVLGFVCFLTQTGQLRSIGLLVLCVGVVLCWASITCRQQVVRSLRRMASSDAPPTSVATAIPAWERLVTICVRWALAGAAITGAGLVCLFTLGNHNRWIGVVLLADGVLQVSLAFVLRGRARRVLGRLRTLAADR